MSDGTWIIGRVIMLSDSLRAGVRRTSPIMLRLCRTTSIKIRCAVTRNENAFAYFKRNIFQRRHGTGGFSVCAFAKRGQQMGGEFRRVGGKWWVSEEVAKAHMASYPTMGANHGHLN